MHLLYFTCQVDFRMHYMSFINVLKYTTCMMFEMPGVYKSANRCWFCHSVLGYFQDNAREGLVTGCNCDHIFKIQNILTEYARLSNSVQIIEFAAVMCHFKCYFPKEYFAIYIVLYLFIVSVFNFT